MTGLPYNPKHFPRELKPYYISASQEEIQNMLETLQLENMDQLYTHLPPQILMQYSAQLVKGLE